MRSTELIYAIKVMKKYNLTPSMNIMMLALYNAGNHSSDRKLAEVAGESESFVRVFMRMLHLRGYVNKRENAFTEKGVAYMSELMV